MATSELGNNFVSTGSILKDWTKAMTAVEPSVEAEAVLEALLVEQNCDLENQFYGDLAATGEDSLSNYIKLYVRDNSSDSTQMPPSVCLNFNSQELSSGESDIEMVGDLSTTSVVPSIAHVTDPFPYYGAREAPWNINNGWVFFNQGCDLELRYSFVLSLDVPQTDLTTVNWRLSNSGTNRFVVVTPIIEVEGSLATGQTARIALPSASFYPENLAGRTKINLAGRIKLSALQSDFTLGRIERLRMVLSRSPWVASSAGGVRDVVTLAKQSLEGVMDSSNYLEIIEL